MAELLTSTDLEYRFNAPARPSQAPAARHRTHERLRARGQNRRLARALHKQGWTTRVSADNETFGGFCAIEILPDGTFVGVADLRRTNAARGY